MAIEHAQSGEVIDIRPLAEKLSESKTHTLLKTEHMEVLRMVLPAGKVIEKFSPEWLEALTVIGVEIWNPPPEP